MLLHTLVDSMVREAERSQGLKVDAALRLNAHLRTRSSLVWSNVYPPYLMRRSSNTQNHFCTGVALLAGMVISLCLSFGAGFRLLLVQADEQTPAQSGVSAGVQNSPPSLLPDGVTTRKGTTSVAQKRIKRQSQDWATLASPCAHELSPNIDGWAVAVQVQSLYSFHSISIRSGRSPPLFV